MRIEKKRRAKTFNLSKKTYEVDETTGEIIDDPMNESPAEQTSMKVDLDRVDQSNKESGKELLTKKNRVSVDMAEIEPNMEHLSISGSYVSEMEFPSYENELNQKFGSNTTSDDIHSIESDLSQQVATMMHESNMHAKAEPLREAKVTIESYQPIERSDSSYHNEDTVERTNSVYEEAEGAFHEATTVKESNRSKQNHSSHHEGKTHCNDSSDDVTTEDIANEIQAKVEKPYVFPRMDLLARPKKNVSGMTESDLKETASKLQKTLESFGVRATITNVTCGPSVTRYEIQPEQGVKVSTITKLADDIKLNLAATDIRIEAPIPGKAAVGIEVPNKENSQ